MNKTTKNNNTKEEFGDIEKVPLILSTIVLIAVTILSHVYLKMNWGGAFIFATIPYSLIACRGLAKEIG